MYKQIPPLYSLGDWVLFGTFDQLISFLFSRSASQNRSTGLIGLAHSHIPCDVFRTTVKQHIRSAIRCSSNDGWKDSSSLLVFPKSQSVSCIIMNIIKTRHFYLPRSHRMVAPAGTTAAASTFVALQAAFLWINYLFKRGGAPAPPAPVAAASEIGAACPLPAEAPGSWSSLAVGFVATLAFLAGVGVAAICIAGVCWCSGLGAVLLAGASSRLRGCKRPTDSPLAVIAPYGSGTGGSPPRPVEDW